FPGPASLPDALFHQRSSPTEGPVEEDESAPGKRVAPPIPQEDRADPAVAGLQWKAGDPCPAPRRGQARGIGAPVAPGHGARREATALLHHRAAAQVAG